MNHRAAAAFDHLRDQKTIKADGRQEVEVQFGQPVVVCKGSEASAWCRRSTKNMSQDVDAAKALKGGLGQGCCPSDVFRSARTNSTLSTDSGVPRAEVITRAPPARKRSTVARPAPLVPPLTSTRFPANSVGSTLLFMP